MGGIAGRSQTLTYPARRGRLGRTVPRFAGHNHPHPQNACRNLGPPPGGRSQRAHRQRRRRGGPPPEPSRQAFPRLHPAHRARRGGQPRQAGGPGAGGRRVRHPPHRAVVHPRRRTDAVRGAARARFAARGQGAADPRGHRGRGRGEGGAAGVPRPGRARQAPRRRRLPGRGPRGRALPAGEPRPALQRHPRHPPARARAAGREGRRGALRQRDAGGRPGGAGPPRARVRLAQLFARPQQAPRVSRSPFRRPSTTTRRWATS